MKDDIRVIYPDSYPETLREISRTPDQLFMRGNFPANKHQKYLCVVGARSSSSYGRAACEKLLSGLKGYPITIVSGLALGIDSYSHEMALKYELNCIGFPGSPLHWNMIYPESSAPLAKRIVENGGALLSEYGPQFEYAKWFFPSRNRLMAGISHATLVIEARKRSGSLMTAKYAESFSRDVLTVPGSIFSELSYGPGMLLKGCANPVMDSYDILEILGFEVIRRSKEKAEKIKELDQMSQKILKLIGYGETTLNDIADSTGMNSTELSIALSTLELEGYVKIQGAVVRLA